MKYDHPYSLTVAQVAEHYGLTTRTVRQWLNTGTLQGVRIGGQWRCRWPDVWALEAGPMPIGPRAPEYFQPLLTKRDFGSRWAVSERTVERWIRERGLPTRCVLDNVRIAPTDAEVWVRVTSGRTPEPAQ